MHYGQIIEEFIEKMKVPVLENFIFSKLIARVTVLSKIILKLVERTHAFVP